MKKRRKYRPRGLSKKEIVDYILEHSIESEDGKGCLISDFSLDTCGYQQTQFKGKIIKICRLVCEVYHGPSNGRDVCHSCCNRQCNNPDHLRWDTKQENSRDTARHGNVAGQKLKPSDIKMIHEYRKNGMLQREIADIYGVSHQQISRILNGERWGWVNTED